MTPAARRDMIVRAALPLVTTHGTAVTTAEIARAAGIGEATIFRAFADKAELLDACVAAALRNDEVLAALESVPLDQPLAARLTAAAVVVRAYLDRLGAVIGALHASGHGRSRPAPDDGRARTAATDRTLRAVLRLLEPDAAALRLPVVQVAGIFLGLLQTRTWDAPLSSVVDVLLHGALA